MFIVPNDKVSINSNTCSSKSRNKNSSKISTVKCRKFRSYATKLQDERAILRSFGNHHKPEKQF